jgi:hypothetical protein
MVVGHGSVWIVLGIRYPVSGAVENSMPGMCSTALNIGMASALRQRHCTRPELLCILGMTDRPVLRDPVLNRWIHQEMELEPWPAIHPMVSTR